MKVASLLVGVRHSAARGRLCSISAPIAVIGCVLHALHHSLNFPDCTDFYFKPIKKALLIIFNHFVVFVLANTLLPRAFSANGEALYAVPRLCACGCWCVQSLPHLKYYYTREKTQTGSEHCLPGWPINSENRGESGVETCIEHRKMTGRGGLQSGPSCSVCAKTRANERCEATEEVRRRSAKGRWGLEVCSWSPLIEDCNRNDPSLSPREPGKTRGMGKKGGKERAVCARPRYLFRNYRERFRGCGGDAAANLPGSAITECARWCAAIRLLAPASAACR